MEKTHLFQFSSPPIVIGGIGGSGTRLIAESLSQLGVFIGRDLNQASDNLLFTLLFKRTEILTTTNDEFNQLLDIFITGMFGSPLSAKQTKIINKLSTHPRDQHTLNWLKERVTRLHEQQTQASPDRVWGWKEPNSHIFLDRLITQFPQMKYIHVSRNGLDMAYSSNQNQLKLWGRNIIGEHTVNDPYYSLKFWRTAHERVFSTKKKLANNFYFLNFDNYCINQDTEIRKLLNFLHIDTTQKQLDSLKALIKKPSTIGRFKEHNSDIFDIDDLEYVKKLGFMTR